MERKHMLQHVPLAVWPSYTYFHIYACWSCLLAFSSRFVKILENRNNKPRTSLPALRRNETHVQETSWMVKRQRNFRRLVRRRSQRSNTYRNDDFAFKALDVPCALKGIPELSDLQETPTSSEEEIAPWWAMLGIACCYKVVFEILPPLEKHQRMIGASLRRASDPAKSDASDSAKDTGHFPRRHVR